MAIDIFRTESGAYETWLTVNDDGTVTYVTSPAWWRMVRRGMERKEQTMTAEEAKKRWSSYANKIDDALATISKKAEPPDSPN